MSELALFDLPGAPSGRPRSRVLPQLVKAVKQAEHLTPADGAAVQLAMRLAADIDRTELGGKGSAAFSAQLLTVLRDLGMTPRARRLAGQETATESAEGVNPLDQLRAIRESRWNAAGQSGS